MEFWEVNMPIWMRVLTSFKFDTFQFCSLFLFLSLEVN